MAGQIDNLHGCFFGKAGDDFLVGERLGTGAFGTVYRATQVELEREVALKVAHPSADGTYPDKPKQRFLREARMVARLSNEFTVRMYDYGTDQATGLLYMAFELVRGTTLSNLIHHHGPVEPGRVVDILKKALQSLHEAHSLGIVHRDIKPGNIMVYDEKFPNMERLDRVKVLDFGIGKFISDESRVTLTATTTTIGTPRYMSPEQMRGRSLDPDETRLGEDVGPWSDIYSLGVVAWEMLTGRPLYGVDLNAFTLAEKVLNERNVIRLPDDACREATGLRRIVEKMCAKRVEDRYKKCTDVIRDLTHLRALDTDEIEVIPEAPQSVHAFERPPEAVEFEREKPGNRESVSARSPDHVRHVRPPGGEAGSKRAPSNMAMVALWSLAGLCALFGVTWALWPAGSFEQQTATTQHGATVSSAATQQLPTELTAIEQVEFDTSTIETGRATEQAAGLAQAAATAAKVAALEEPVPQERRVEAKRPRTVESPRKIEKPVEATVETDETDQKNPDEAHAGMAAEKSAEQLDVTEISSGEAKGDTEPQKQKERKRPIKRPEVWGVE